MGLSPVYVGDTLIPLQPTFIDDNEDPVNISNATFGITLKNISTNEVIQGNGTWLILDGINGVATYQWDILDVSKVGIYNLIISITINGRSVHCDPQLLLVQANT